MLQIDHVYEFLYQELFKDFDFYYLPKGVPDPGNLSYYVFTKGLDTTKKIFLYDQEPFIPALVSDYLRMFTFEKELPVETLFDLARTNSLPYNIKVNDRALKFYIENPGYFFKKRVLVTSELSTIVEELCSSYELYNLYYFFHGFAALDWYRGYYALNYDKSVDKLYKHDFISYNRLITDDRSYRLYFISKLAEYNLIQDNLISFNISDIEQDWLSELSSPTTKLSDKAVTHIKLHCPQHKIIIDNPYVPGDASADIPRAIDYMDATISLDALWHIVTETVFYYPKLHLTEKIFKPIVSKQPFMLLAAPGNLAYLKNYGFKTFDAIIDESYDDIYNNDTRVEAVVNQLKWYCGLTNKEKKEIIQEIAPIVEYNFHHFYGDFKHIITKELLDNTKNLFKEIGYDDSSIAYQTIYRVLTN